jgi:hypothetical protein
MWLSSLDPKLVLNGTTVGDTSDLLPTEDLVYLYSKICCDLIHSHVLLQDFKLAVQLVISLIYPCREAEMREVSEKTNGRVAWFSILSLSVCIAVSVLQVWHLQGYFAKKKLI